MGSQGVAMSVLSPICLISCIFIAKSAANPKFYIIETEDRPGENAPQQPFAVEHGEDYGEYTTPKSWTTTPKPKEIDHKWTTKEHKWTTTPKPKQIDHKWTTTPDHTSSCAGCWVDAPIDGEIVDFARKKLKEKGKMDACADRVNHQVSHFQIKHVLGTNKHKFDITCKTKAGEFSSCLVEIHKKWDGKKELKEAQCVDTNKLKEDIVDFAVGKLKQKRELKNLYNNCGKDFRKVKDWPERTDLNSNQAVDGIIYKFELECPTDRKGRPDLPKKFNCDVEVYTGPYKREMREGHCVSIN